MRLLNPGPLSRLIVNTVELLRQPAGKQYDSMEAITRDCDQFIQSFHHGFFTIHLFTIYAIMKVEADLKSLAGDKANPSSRIALEHTRQILRSINDSLVWILLGEEASFKVTRLSRGRKKGHLADQNPESVLRFLAKVSSSGKAIGIWNDATRCVDLADVTVFDPFQGITFMELKKGKVNEAVFETIQAGGIPAIDSFYNTFGKKGLEQLERTIKQQIDAKKHETLLSNDTVIDPFLGTPRVAVTPNFPPAIYDDELKESLSHVRSREFVTLTIDECLHLILVNAERIDRTKGKFDYKEARCRNQRLDAICMGDHQCLPEQTDNLHGQLSSPQSSDGGELYIHRTSAVTR